MPLKVSFDLLENRLMNFLETLSACDTLVPL